MDRLEVLKRKSEEMDKQLEELRMAIEKLDKIYKKRYPWWDSDSDNETT